MGSSKIEMNKLGWLPLVVVALVGHSVRCSPTPQASDPGEFRVDTVDGPVIGSIRQSNDGLPFASFEGIPFASPPVGDLRFAPPQPVKPWTDPLNLTGTFHGKCIQYGYYSAPEPVISGSEDCLYLNVWAPVKKTKELKAVMMWIYGGSLTGGSQNFFEHGQSWCPSLSPLRSVWMCPRRCAPGPSQTPERSRSLSSRNGAMSPLRSLAWPKHLDFKVQPNKQHQQQQNCRSSQLYSKILPKTAGNLNPTSHDAFFRLTKNHETRDDTKKLNVYPLNLTQKVCHEQRVKVSKVQQSQM